MNQRGFSLISTLISMSLVSIAFVTLNASKLNVLKSQKYLEGASEHNSVEDTLLKRFAEETQREVLENCLENLFESYDKKTLMKTGGVQIRMRFVDEGLSISGDRIPNRFKAAAQRCNNYSYSRDEEKYYFCLQFDQRRSHQALFGNIDGGNEILTSPESFIEYAVQFRHLKENLALNCTEYKENYKEAAILIFYTMYWTMESGSQKTFHYKNGLAFQGAR